MEGNVPEVHIRSCCLAYLSCIVLIVRVGKGQRSNTHTGVTLYYKKQLKETEKLYI